MGYGRLNKKGETRMKYNDTEISEDIKYIGVDDKEIDLFEGQYVVPNGISYNSYLIKDEKTVVMDTVDKRKSKESINLLLKIIVTSVPCHYEHRQDERITPHQMENSDQIY